VTTRRGWRQRAVAPVVAPGRDVRRRPRTGTLSRRSSQAAAQAPVGSHLAGRGCPEAPGRCGDGGRDSKVAVKGLSSPAAERQRTLPAVLARHDCDLEVESGSVRRMPATSARRGPTSTRSRIRAVSRRASKSRRRSPGAAGKRPRAPQEPADPALWADASWPLD
jgi:hypothetical protein